MVGWNRILGREPATGLIGFMVLGDLPESFSIAQDYQQIIQKIASGPLREVVSS
jgi:hypothetical protein